MFIIPSKKIADQLRDSCKESFYLDYDEDYKNLILYLNLYQHLALSVMNGVPLTIVFRNPKIEKNSITLYIHDIPTNPFYITKRFNSKFESKNFPGLYSYADDFVSRNALIVTIFDETLRCLGAQITQILRPDIELIDWLSDTNESQVDIGGKDYFPEDLSKGYIINIAPIKINESSNLIQFNFRTWKKWGEEAYTINTNKYSPVFDVNDYTPSGKQGYFQEQNLKEILSDYFMPNVNLFSSPLRDNGKEITDIVFGIKGYLILVESKTTEPYIDQKYVKIKARERAISALIKKACKQLIVAEKLLLESPNEVQDESLMKHYMPVKDVVKICVINDITLINLKSLHNVLSIFDRTQLPIIIELSTFYKIIFTLKNPLKIIERLVDINEQLIFEEDLPLVKEVILN